MFSLSDPVSEPIWDPFGLPCLRQYTLKIIKIHSELPFQIENDLLGVDIEICQNLEAIWAQFCHQKSTNIKEYSPSKGYQHLLRILLFFI